MQTRTEPQDEPDAVGDGRVVEREVETVRTQQRVTGAPVDSSVPQGAIAGAQPGGYFETLPERLRGVALVALAALEGVLSIRFLLHAFGARPASGFVGFIDDVSWPFVRPFTNAFSDRTWDQGIMEISTLVAMGVYLLAFALIAMLVTALAPRLSSDVHSAA